LLASILSANRYTYYTKHIYIIISTLLGEYIPNLSHRILTWVLTVTQYT